MASTEADFTATHRHSSNHRAEVLASDVCGCFYCSATFAPASIVEWVDDGSTALCPRCGIDSVLGSNAGYRIDAAFLGEMHRRWFGRP